MLHFRIELDAEDCHDGADERLRSCPEPFEGDWNVKDTAGETFVMTLSANRAARATRGEGMTGTWKQEGDSAVITWDTGWTTKITRQGNGCEKTAFRKGQSLTGEATNRSSAEKVK